MWLQADGQRKELQRITADNKRLYRSLQVCHVLPSFYNCKVVYYVAGDQTHCAVAEADQAQREGSRQVRASVPVHLWRHRCLAITFQQMV